MTTRAEPGHDASSPTWPLRFVMLVGGFMITLAMGAVAPILPQIETALAHGADERLLVKMLIPIAGGAMVVGAPLTGFLIDRVGLRPVLLVHGMLFALGGTAGLYVTDIYTLVGSRLLVGFSAAGLATTSMTVINTRLDGNARARWMGFHISVAMLGSLVAYPLIGALGEIGWRWPFAVYAFGLIVAAVGLLALQTEPRIVRPASDEGPHDRESLLRWFPLQFIPLALVVGSVTYLPTVYIAFIARGIGVSSPSTLSSLMLMDALIGATMSLLFGWARRRISSEAAFVFSFVCTGTGMLIVSLASSVVGIVLGMFVFGFGIGWFMPNVMTSLSRRVSHNQQGRAVGILKAFHHLASPAAVLALEPVARAFGPSGATMASAVTCYLTAALFLFLAVRRGPDRIGKSIAVPGAMAEVA